LVLGFETLVFGVVVQLEDEGFAVSFQPALAGGPGEICVLAEGFAVGGFY
jgi:hypothetical protein